MEFPQMNIEKSAGTIVEMKTNNGIIKIKLFDSLVPKTVKNFIGLIEEGFYNNTVFHRVIKNFMIQGGDPTGTGMGGKSIYDDKAFEDEFVDNLFNLRGAISMANSGPNTNKSQFFIVQSKNVDKRLKKEMLDKYSEEIVNEYIENGGTPWLDKHHTVFGQVIEGLDIIDKIADKNVDYTDKPIDAVIIEKIEIKK